MNSIFKSSNMPKYIYYILFVILVIAYIVFGTKKTVKYSFNTPFNNVVEGFGEGLLDIFKSSEDIEDDIDNMLTTNVDIQTITKSDKLNITPPIYATTSDPRGIDPSDPSPIDNNVTTLQNTNIDNLVKKPVDVRVNSGANAKGGPHGLEKPDGQVNILKDKCKFFNNRTCTSEYPIFTGASLGIENSNMICDTDNDDKFREAVVVSDIKNNRIIKVHVVDSGYGYFQKPDIVIEGGGGKDAELDVIINKKNGGINRIIINNPGSGYTNTPSIKLIPVGGSKCYLCCKDDN
jgi:hypothetical protein